MPGNRIPAEVELAWIDLDVADIIGPPGAGDNADLRLVDLWIRRRRTVGDCAFLFGLRVTLAGGAGHTRLSGGLAIGIMVLGFASLGIRTGIVVVGHDPRQPRATDMRRRLTAGIRRCIMGLRRRRWSGAELLSTHKKHHRARSLLGRASMSLEPSVKDYSSQQLAEPVGFEL